MQSVYTILLLIVSNIFMTCAWYGHLKMKQQFSWFEHLPLFGVILFSWFLAFFEYCFQVPANRIGFRDNGVISIAGNTEETVPQATRIILTLCCLRNSISCLA